MRELEAERERERAEWGAREAALLAEAACARETEGRNKRALRELLRVLQVREYARAVAGRFTSGARESTSGAANSPEGWGL